MNTKLYNLLCCPNCKGSLTKKGNTFYCKTCKKNYPIREGIPDFTVTIAEKGMRLSKLKWEEKYKIDSKKDIFDELNFLENKFFKPTWEQLKSKKSLRKNENFLEIGCGTFYLGRALAKKGYRVIGIDMSITALKLAKSVFEKEKIKNYLLVCGNVLEMPFKPDSFDLIYGAGVIEHFKDTKQAVAELYRVTKKKGVVYNTVPYLNIGSLTYRQVWGNIPRFAVLEPVLTFFHTKLLGAKHMRFGYELSFTRNYLKKLHKKVGFSLADSGKFKCELDFEYIPFSPLKKLAFYLAENSSLFWPMIYISAKK